MNFELILQILTDCPATFTTKYFVQVMNLATTEFQDLDNIRGMQVSQDLYGVYIFVQIVHLA